MKLKLKMPGYNMMNIEYEEYLNKPLIKRLFIRFLYWLNGIDIKSGCFKRTGCSAF